MKSLRDLSKIEIHKMSMKIVANPNSNEENWIAYLETMPREILVDLYDDIRHHSSEYLHAGLTNKNIAEEYLHAIWLETVFYQRFYNYSMNIYDYLKPSTK